MRGPHSGFPHRRKVERRRQAWPRLPDVPGQGRRAPQCHPPSTVATAAIKRGSYVSGFKRFEEAYVYAPGARIQLASCLHDGSLPNPTSKPYTTGEISLVLLVNTLLSS
jgi:hypothetical protein